MAYPTAAKSALAGLRLKGSDLQKATRCMTYRRLSTDSEVQISCSNDYQIRSRRNLKTSNCLFRENNQLTSEFTHTIRSLEKIINFQVKNMGMKSRLKRLSWPLQKEKMRAFSSLGIFIQATSANPDLAMWHYRLYDTMDIGNVSTDKFKYKLK